MATTTQTTDRIERSLSALLAEVDWLPNTVTEWATTPESERISISLDWDHLLIDYLAELDVYYFLDEMTAEQQERYQTLLQKLRDAQPLFTQIGISQPRIPLHDVPLTEITFAQDEIDTQLALVTAETASLPKRLHRAIRNLGRADDDWQIDWHNFAARLRGLEHAARSDVMSGEQCARYRILRHDLADYLPFLRDHGSDLVAQSFTPKSTAAD